MRRLILLVCYLMLSGPLGAGELPTELDLSGKKVQLQVYAWRDFMPGVGVSGDGSDLMLVPSLVDQSGAKISGVSFDLIEANFQGKVWSAKPDEGGTARGGPKWPPGQNISVKAHYRCGGKSGWLKLAKPTRIEQTF